MSDTVESPGSRWLRPSRRTTWVVLATVLLVLLALLPLALRWWTHPDLLPDRAGRSRWVPQPVDQAATAFTVLPPRASGHPTPLTWHAARADLATNTARASVSFSLCDTPLMKGQLESSYQTIQLTQICSVQRALTDGTRLTYPDPHQLVLMTLTPTRPGVVHVTGVDVRYSLGADHLFRHGTEHVALDARLTTR